MKKLIAPVTVGLALSVGSGAARSEEPAKSARCEAQIGSVERYPTDGVVTLTRRVLTPKSPNRRIR